MPKTRPPYAAEFRQQMVDLVRAGRMPEDLAREFEPSSQAIRTWVAQADRDTGGRSDGLRTEEREELRRENRRLREEREISVSPRARTTRGVVVRRRLGRRPMPTSRLGCSRFTVTAAGRMVPLGFTPS